MKKHVLSVLAILSLSTANLNVTAAEPGNRARKMLTAELAQSLLGGAVEESSRNSVADTQVGDTWVSTAAYMLKNGNSQVSVLIRHGSKEETKSAYVQCKDMYKGVEVKGIGEAAYRTTTPAQLCVLKGNNWLIFMCGPFTKPDTAGQEKAAKAVLSKLTD